MRADEREGPDIRCASPHVVHLTVVEEDGNGWAMKFRSKGYMVTHKVGRFVHGTDRDTLTRSKQSHRLNLLTEQFVPDRGLCTNT